MKRLLCSLSLIVLACSFAVAQAPAPAAPTNKDLELAQPPAPPEGIEQEHLLTVNSGEGGGSYVPGAEVEIAPLAPPAGKVFDKWTGNREVLEMPDLPGAHITMPGNDVVITATYKDAPPDAAGAFLEMNGLVVMEAESATTTTGVLGAEGNAWEKVEPFEDAIGAVMQALPNEDIHAGDGSDGPALNFRVYFQNPGEYYFFLRLPVLGPRDNSANVGLDGQVLNPNVYNSSGRWNWSGARGEPVVAVIPEPGVHTVNIWMREDGVAVDRVMLRRNPAPLTALDDPAYPPESPRLPEPKPEDTP
jgi:hypothetical protein